MKRFNAAKALQVDETLYTPLQRAILFVFSEIIYRPLFEIVKEELTDEWVDLELKKVLKERKEQKADDLRAEIKRNKEEYSYLYHNAKMKEASQNPLVKAILSGRVQYIGGCFEGSFNAGISKEIKALGGVWDWKRKKWRLESSKLSPQVSLAIGTASGKMGKVKERISHHLNEVSNMFQNDPHFTFEKAFEQAVTELEKKFREGIEGIVVPPEFTPEMLRTLVEEYSDNMNLYIKGWTEESIRRLRDRILINTFEGNRSSNLVKNLEHDFQISYNKAKFLARQETSLLMSKYREERYKSCGVQKYMWSTSGDSRVRPYHKRLNGKIFTWDDPPVVDDMGNKKHPGQDYQCRCIAIPIID